MEKGPDVRKGKRLPLESLEPFLLPLPDPPGPCDWPAVFHNSHPVELEIGFGKGAFLVAASQAHPEVNYVGVEIDRGLQLYVANRIAKRNLHNVRLAKADARDFLKLHVAAASLRAIHVYFPDPWWKKRHKKRRVFTAEFANDCERVLVPGGRLHIATDVEEYFVVMCQLAAERPDLQRVEVLDQPELVPADDALTNFQRKALRRGGHVYYAIFERQ
jgi:tRNA (guanine-N7-)-methyltransferase